MFKFRRYASPRCYNPGWSVRIGRKPPFCPLIDIRYFNGESEINRGKFIRGHIGRFYFDHSIGKQVRA